MNMNLNNFAPLAQIHALQNRGHVVLVSKNVKYPNLVDEKCQDCDWWNQQ